MRNISQENMSINPEYCSPTPARAAQCIAAILDKADAIQRKREAGFRLTEELLRSTFLDMFGDPVRNENHWPRRGCRMLAKSNSEGSVPLDFSPASTHDRMCGSQERLRGSH